MSQKPKSGTQAREASATPVAPKEAVMKAKPTAERPSVKAEPVAKLEPASKAESVAKVEPIQTVPAVVPEPKTKTETAMRDDPVIKYEPTAKADSVVDIAQEAKVFAAESVNKTIEAASGATAASVDAISETMKATADKVTAVATDAVETASSMKPITPKLTQGMKTMMKSTEDFVAFGQANLEAFMKSGQIWSAGMQELTKQFATTAKASFEESVSTFKAISTAKSVKEAMELQSTFAKSALEKAMAESNKLTDASIKLTEQTLAPITARVTVAVETFGKAA
jgi:phasin family protein